MFPFKIVEKNCLFNHLCSFYISKIDNYLLRFLVTVSSKYRIVHKHSNLLTVKKKQQQ